MNIKLFSTLLATSTSGKSFYLPEQASTVAGQVDSVFKLILYVSSVFFIGIVLSTVYFVIKYRYRGPDDKTSPIHENLALEITWIIVPTILLAYFFLAGFNAWMPLNYAPANSMEIRVTAQQWGWSFAYPREGISRVNKIVVPVGKPVKLIMGSVDVLHSFFVPAFRIKRDVLPGRYSVAWFQATKKGKFTVFCTEYCGKDHSRMVSMVEVVSEEEYQEWLETERTKGIDGKALYASLACSGCHSLDGTRGTGPSFKGLYGRNEKVTKGIGGSPMTIKVDDNYIRNSILNPNAHIVQGYAPAMPTYKGRISMPELNAIVDFIKYLDKKKK